MRFRLIGRVAPIFRATRVYYAAGFIPTVVGISEDGLLTTTARIADIDLVPDIEIEEIVEYVGVGA